METGNSIAFKPMRAVPDFVASDHSALATQIDLCRTDQSGWHSLCTLAEQVQAFTAQHVLSTLVLLGIGACLTFWLIG